MSYNFTKHKTANFTVAVDRAANYGYFEHDEYGDECGGGLWFESKALVDYDGVGELDTEVIDKLAELGYDVSEVA